METTEMTMFTETVKYSGTQLWIEPVCAFFNVSVQNQYRKLKKDPILSNLWTKKSADLGEIDKNGRVLLTKKGFVRWIQIINPNTISDPLREKFILYQSLVFDYLYGSAEDDETLRIHYNRMQKLERLYSKIGMEIKKEKAIVSSFLNGRYTQLSLNLRPEHQLVDSH